MCESVVCRGKWSVTNSFIRGATPGLGLLLCEVFTYLTLILELSQKYENVIVDIRVAGIKFIQSFSLQISNGKIGKSEEAESSVG